MPKMFERIPVQGTVMKGIEAGDIVMQKSEELLLFKDISQASVDVLIERERQVVEEGYTPEYDDHYCKDGDMAKAGACYALGNPIIANKAGHKIRIWPWSKIGWNPKDKRRNLVRAAALIIAEIEKLDRKECTIMKTYHDQDSWEERDDAPSAMIIVWVVCSLIAGLAALLYFAA